MSADWQGDVLSFCIRFRVPFHSKPTVPRDRRSVAGMMGTRKNRKKLLREETRELSKAIDEGDLSHVAKETADVIFVALGIATTYGISMQPVWDLVQESNMAKQGGGLRPDGKILKPEGWQAPDIQAEIDRQG